MHERERLHRGGPNALHVRLGVVEPLAAGALVRGRYGHEPGHDLGVGDVRVREPVGVEHGSHQRADGIFFEPGQRGALARDGPLPGELAAAVVDGEDGVHGILGQHAVKGVERAHVGLLDDRFGVPELFHERGHHHLDRGPRRLAQLLQQRLPYLKRREGDLKVRIPQELVQEGDELVDPRERRAAPGREPRDACAQPLDGFSANLPVAQVVQRADRLRGDEPELRAAVHHRHDDAMAYSSLSAPPPRPPNA